MAITSFIAVPAFCQITKIFTVAGDALGQTYKNVMFLIGCEMKPCLGLFASKVGSPLIISNPGVFSMVMFSTRLTKLLNTAALSKTFDSNIAFPYQNINSESRPS